MRQSDLADALGLSRATVSRSVAAGMPTGSPEAARAWRAERVRPRVASAPPARPTPPGPAAGDVLTVAGERALLLRRQRQAIEHDLAERRGKLAPISYLRETLAAITAELGNQLDAAPVALRRAHPELSADVLAALGATLVQIRNQAADAAAEAARRVAAGAHYEFPGAPDDEGDDDAEPPTD